MAKVLINDGIHPTGLNILLNAGIAVDIEKIPQDELVSKLNEYDAIFVRSATKIYKNEIDASPNLKVIGRGGVGLDNIDVDYAQEKGVKVFNTPAASSRSVAELAFAHIFSITRFLFQANRLMPEDGDNNFKGLKKAYSEGLELKGKTLGLLGIGRIGQETAKIALGLGMKILAVDPFIERITLGLEIGGQVVDIPVETVSREEMFAKADFISLHLPFLGEPVLTSNEFDQMKDGVIVINAARGGTIDEDALLSALDSGKVAAAGLDVFSNEPNPRQDLLQHPRVSLSPHIGASTKEAQEKIGIELAEKLINLLN